MWRLQFRCRLRNSINTHISKHIFLCPDAPSRISRGASPRNHWLALQNRHKVERQRGEARPDDGARAPRPHSRTRVALCSLVESVDGAWYESYLSSIFHPYIWSRCSNWFNLTLLDGVTWRCISIKPHVLIFYDWFLVCFLFITFLNDWKFNTQKF